MNPQRDNQIMKILKVQEFSHFIGQTNRGNVTAKILKDTDKYTFYLDSVPVSEEFNKLLLQLLK